MSEPRIPDSPSFNKVSPQKNLWVRLLPIVLTFLIFGLIFWRIPFEEFWRALSRARLLPFLALMGVFSLCYFLLDTFVLSKAVRWFHGPLPYRKLLPVRAVTYLVSIVNTQLAQAALALYIYRRFRTPLGQITSTVALLIMLEVTNLIIFATVGTIAFPGGTPIILLILPLMLALLWIFVMGFARGTLGQKLKNNVILSTFRHTGPGQCATILVLKGFIFFLALLVHSRALAFFGIEIPLMRLLAFLPIVFLVAALPITVAHLGTSQAAWMFFFGSYAPEADLLAYSLASHLTFMLANGTFGLIFLPKAYSDLFVTERANSENGDAATKKQPVRK